MIAARPRQRWDWGMLALMGVAAVAAIAGFGVLFSLWIQTRLPDKSEALNIALERFNAGERIVASDLAEQVELDPAVPEEATWISLREFLVGAGHVARAEAEPAGSQRRQLLYDAVPFLQLSAKQKFPPGRQAEGYRLLGEAQHALGRYDDAIESLQQALERDPSLHRALAPPLAESLLRSTGRLAEQAFETIDQYRDDISLTPPQRRAGELIRIEALIALRRWDDAAATIGRALASIGPVSDATPGGRAAATLRRFRSRLRLLQAAMRVSQLFSESGDSPLLTTLPSPGSRPEQTPGRSGALAGVIADLNDLQREADGKLAAQTQLLLAKTHLLRGEPDLALAEWTAVRQQRPFGGEGVAAGLLEIELLANRSRGAEAVQAARFIIRELGDPRGYDGSLIPFRQFERRLVAAVEKLQDQGEYESAIDIARVLPPVFGASESLIQEGSAYRQWADATLAEERQRRREVSPAVAALARSRYRAAGDAFANAAELKFTSERYLPTLWSAIDAYQEGNHFRRSLTLLEPYLQYEQRQRQPRGLIAIGRALLAEGGAENYRRAIDRLDQCVEEHPRDPLRYEARLLAAYALSELGQMEEAQERLQGNLRDGSLAPTSPVWRNSLFTLGELLYRQVNEKQLLADHAREQERQRLMRESREVIDDALRSLNQAVERYWPRGGNPTRPPRRALHSAYLAARTHRIAARLPIMEADSPETTSIDRRRSRLASANELRAALDRYLRLREYLEQQLDEESDESRLPRYELALLRNCLVGEADTLFEMDRLEEAANAYGSVTLRYMNEPLALEGILGHAECLRRLGRHREADSRVRQASLVLRRIPDEWNDRFEEITRYSRGEWDRLLTWMNDRIRERDV